MNSLQAPFHSIDVLEFVTRQQGMHVTSPTFGIVQFGSKEIQGDALVFVRRSSCEKQFVESINSGCGRRVFFEKLCCQRRRRIPDEGRIEDEQLL